MGEWKGSRQIVRYSLLTTRYSLLANRYSPIAARDQGGTVMLARTLLCVIACAALAATAGAQIIDYSKYPDLGGQWRPIGGPGRFDISKPGGRGQQAPLTAEYQA